MSDQNVDFVRRMYESFAKGDVPAVLNSLDPEVDWREAENFIYSGGNPYRSPNAVLEGVFMPLATEWENFSVAPDEILDAGDTVVGLGHYIGTYKTTGQKVRAQFAHVFTLRDGKVVKFQQYTDTQQFAQAAGR